MIKTLRKFFVTLAAGMLLAVPLAVPVVVSAASDANVSGELCSGAKLDVTDKSECTEESESGPVNKLIGDIINIFSVVVGVVSVIMIIVGGLKYITSGGDSGNITGAKNTILYAIIGLVVVAIAQFLVRFVLGKVSGLTET